MGLFDKFRKKVRDAASEVDTNSLSAEEGSDEAFEALSHQEKLAQSESQQNEILASRIHVPAHKTQPDFGEEEEEWEDFVITEMITEPEIRVGSRFPMSATNGLKATRKGYLASILDGTIPLATAVST